MDITMNMTENGGASASNSDLSGDESNRSSSAAVDIEAQAQEVQKKKKITKMLSSSSMRPSVTKKESSSSSGSGSASKPPRSSWICCKKPKFTRAFALRSLLIISLLGAVAVCTYFSYNTLRESEQEVGKQNFESIASSALTGAKSIWDRKFQGSTVMSTLFSYTHPTSDQWPLIHFDGYIPVADSVAKLGDSTTQSLMVLLNPDEIPTSTFENHTLEAYKRQGRPPEAGVNDHGFGVWKPDPNRPNDCLYDDCRVPHQSSDTDWGGILPVQTPLMYHNIPAAGSLLYNIYAQKNRGVHIESMNACVDANNKALAEGSEPLTGSCAVVTDILELAIRPGPAALIFNPILPANDPIKKFVGFATTSLHWEEALTAIVPDYVYGLTCVIRTGTTSATYEIQGGIPTYVGEGDLHDLAYDHMGRSIDLTADMATGASSAASYTLEVYPTDEMLNAFVTNSPTQVAAIIFGVVAFCTIMFFLYDYLMRHEANQRRAILDMKRRFVRFISHEIRTPLNTVCMGLELLENELKSASDKSGDETLSDDLSCVGFGGAVDGEDIGFWSNVTKDIKDNAHTAVEILNDMLNYDKLEHGGGLNLELSRVRIAEVVDRTVRQFQIQAVNRRVNLKLNIEGLDESDFTSCNDLKELEGQSMSSQNPRTWTTIGDDVRLGQVMRNLISNALKFTPENGDVDISAVYVPDGLPNAKSLCLAIDECGECAFGQRRTGSVRIIVKDTGIGLNKDQLSKLFGEGVQFDANKLQHGGGSGLGLNIAKGIVEQHSGTIRADSEGQGHGTSFILELPLYKFSDLLDNTCSKPGGDDRTVTTTTVTTANEPEEKVFRPKRVLVVEDAVSSLKMLIRLLERSGHSCEGAANGQIAIDKMEEDMQTKKQNPTHIPFDTILIDFEMPFVNGPTATTKIREMGYKGAIVGVTGNVLSEDVQHFKNAGANEVLSKPVSMARIDGYWTKEQARLEASIRRKFRSTNMTGKIS